MTDLKQTLVTARRGFFTRIAGVMALGAAGFAPTEPRAEVEAEDGPDWPGKLTLTRSTTVSLSPDRRHHSATRSFPARAQSRDVGEIQDWRSRKGQ
jgi:hypothetical protein